MIVLDSYGTWPHEGLLEYSPFSLGSYYSCLEIGADDADELIGQYCSYRLRRVDGAKDVSAADDFGFVIPLEPPFTGPANVDLLLVKENIWHRQIQSLSFVSIRGLVFAVQRHFWGLHSQHVHQEGIQGSGSAAVGKRCQDGQDHLPPVQPA